VLATHPAGVREPNGRGSSCGRTGSPTYRRTMAISWVALGREGLRWRAAEPIMIVDGSGIRRPALYVEAAAYRTGAERRCSHGSAPLLLSAAALSSASVDFRRRVAHKRRTGSAAKNGDLPPRPCRSFTPRQRRGCA
jgi:hypothetical protein